ncbi:MAG: RNA methyltransferase [Acidimicrobiia bacterium]|nr:RNA methyltransferase [Acidimicrobiia bacterium]
MAPAGIGTKVEGLHAVSAALAAGRVRRLTIERGRNLDSLLAGAAGIPVTEVPDVRVISETTAPQGVIADCEPIAPHPLKALVARAQRPSLVVLDHVEDPHNLGAVVRSAVAASATGLVVAARRAAPFGAAAFKAAAGALEMLPVTVVNSVADAITRLEELGVWTVGLDADAGESLFECPLFTEPVAVVIGGEGGGLSHLVRERVSKLVHIPMAEGVESLNASVSAALAMYEVRRMRASAS